MFFSFGSFGRFCSFIGPVGLFSSVVVRSFSSVLFYSIVRSVLCSQNKQQSIRKTLPKIPKLR